MEQLLKPGTETNVSAYPEYAYWYRVLDRSIKCEELNTVIPGFIEIQNLLKQFVKESPSLLYNTRQEPLSAGGAKGDLHPFSRVPSFSRLHACKLHYDGTLNLLKMNGTEFVGHTSFNICDGYLEIVQIQGPPYSEDIEDHKKTYWRESLIESAETFANSLGVTHYRVLPAACNKFLPKNSILSDRVFPRFKRNYDISARKCGYTYNRESMWWEKSL
ncbi:hypothetical protein HGA88_01550 [Candidatus Roizmanbacteria bacterium]|nr:hypothetical protein [Candidatus Roizmanbacteria bacterium]